VWKEDQTVSFPSRSSFHGRLFTDSQEQSSINGIDSGFTGFLQPRHLNSTWAYQDPARCSPLLNFTSCYLDENGGETYEGSEWLYSFFVPHDMATLIPLMGGTATYVQRLDRLHDSGLLYIGDEQAFLPVFQYHYAGRPGLSSARIHTYIPAQFNTSLNGLPGNDDSGAMGSFAALSMLGIFPNPGQDVYFITPPFFEEIRLRNPLSGRIATIRNLHFDPTYRKVFVQSATLDGRPYHRNWIGHGFFLEGGVLELTLGAEESDWGTRMEDLPPSLSTARQQQPQQEEEGAYNGM
jgi:putative alpha-1,2-mannosidase